MRQHSYTLSHNSALDLAPLWQQDQDFLAEMRYVIFMVNVVLNQIFWRSFDPRFDNTSTHSRRKRARAFNEQVIKPLPKGNIKDDFKNKELDFCKDAFIAFLRNDLPAHWQTYLLNTMQQERALPFTSIDHLVATLRKLKRVRNAVEHSGKNRVCDYSAFCIILTQFLPPQRVYAWFNCAKRAANTYAPNTDIINQIKTRLDHGIEQRGQRTKHLFHHVRSKKHNRIKAARKRTVSPKVPWRQIWMALRHKDRTEYRAYEFQIRYYDIGPKMVDDMAMLLYGNRMQALLDTSELDKSEKQPTFTLPTVSFKYGIEPLYLVLGDMVKLFNRYDLHIKKHYEKECERFRLDPKAQEIRNHLAHGGGILTALAAKTGAETGNDPQQKIETMHQTIASIFGIWGNYFNRPAHNTQHNCAQGFYNDMCAVLSNNRRVLVHVQGGKHPVAKYRKWHPSLKKKQLRGQKIDIDNCRALRRVLRKWFKALDQAFKTLDTPEKID